MAKDVMHLGKFGSCWLGLGCGESNVGVHGDGDRLQILKSISIEDWVNVRALGEVDHAMLTITFDLDAEQPVELTQIGNVHMLQDLGLEISDKSDWSCCNHTVINMDQHHNDRPPFMPEEDSLVDIAACKA